ncbi:hypothetical protein K9M48_00210 [Candidatus Gracilibacteria bacterium]|nr:hypothetical protein [Candidatus Gracilibacteria bacterium]
MEVFGTKDNIDQQKEQEKEKKTKIKLDALKNELMKGNEIEIESIKKSILSLKSFKDFPIVIKYPESSKEKIDQKKFPQKLDMRPKPFGDKWKNIDGEITNSPEKLFIKLDNRKFIVDPDIGYVSNIIIDQGNIDMHVSKFGILFRKELYTPERMTNLVMILWNHQMGYDTDVTPGDLVDVREVK